MKITRYILTLICVCTLGVGCKSKKNAATPKKERVVINTNTSAKVPVKKEKPKEVTTPIKEKPTVVITPPKNASYVEIVSSYIDTYSAIAKEEMVQYGIPASITLAQGILESGAGRGTLSQRAQNHFGIKCHKEWTGERVYHDDDAAQECFRKYTDPKYSYRDHSLFLTTRSRYKSLFSLAKDDYKGWAKGLKKAGYATDPKYPTKLISLVERYGLDRYDQEVLNLIDTEVTPRVVTQTSPSVKTYKVVKGDTLYSIARRFDMTVETLKAYNGLTDATISIGQTLYLHSVNE